MPEVEPNFKKLMKAKNGLQRKTWMKRTQFKPRRKKPDVPTSMRDVVAVRCKGRCEAKTPVCTGVLEHLHHKLMRSQGGPHTPENLLACCNACHGFIHKHPELSYQQGWLIHPWDASLKLPLLPGEL
jgi:hypothetical protein